MILNAVGMLRDCRRTDVSWETIPDGRSSWTDPVPNDKLHRVTDNRLAEADRKVLHGGVPVEQAGKIWMITGINSFKGEGGNFKLDASVDGQPVKFLENG